MLWLYTCGWFRYLSLNDASQRCRSYGRHCSGNDQFAVGAVTEAKTVTAVTKVCIHTDASCKETTFSFFKSQASRRSSLVITSARHLSALNVKRVPVNQKRCVAPHECPTAKIVLPALRFQSFRHKPRFWPMPSRLRFAAQVALSSDGKIASVRR